MSPKREYLFFFKDTKDITSKNFKVVKVKSNLILLKQNIYYLVVVVKITKKLSSPSPIINKERIF